LLCLTTCHSLIASFSCLSPFPSIAFCSTYRLILFSATSSVWFICTSVASSSWVRASQFIWLLSSLLTFLPSISSWLELSTGHGQLYNFKGPWTSKASKKIRTHWTFFM
jgi:hypothetical protein